MQAPTTRPQTHVEDWTDERLAPMYHLVLLDDDHHTYQYVIVMLGAIFKYTVEKSYAIACAVDSEGRAILMTGGQDEVRTKQEAIHSFGADPMMPESKGSMSAVIEPVE